MAKSISKYLINILFIILISALSIWLIMHDNFSQIKTIITNTPMITFIFLVILGFAPCIIEAFILKKFTNLYLPSYRLKDGFINALTGSFFSGITPFSSGGQFAQAYVFKKQGISYTNSTGILLMHFILYQFCLVIYTLLIMFFKYKEMAHYYNGFLSLAMIGFLCNAVVIVCLLLGSISYKFQHFLTDTVLKLAYRFHLVKDYHAKKNKLEKYLVDFHRELKVIGRHPKEMTYISFLFILKLTVLYSLPYVISYALGYPMNNTSFFDYFAICAFIYLITSFIPLPGASGGSEGTYVLLYTAMMGSLLAQSSMLIWRFITYYFVVFIGCISFMIFINIKNVSKKGGK